MSTNGAFLVEEFLGAIASQLDRTQDALSAKKYNRPLTYAIKDFTMELKVFVDMDPEGRVRLRSPSVNESGASVVTVGFTTITRTMIEENAADIALTRAPTLKEAGLPEADRLRLERLGVRTTAELKNLGGGAGTAGLSRLAGIPLDRLRAALAFGRPQIGGVRPVPPRPPVPPQRPPATPPPVIAQPPRPQPTPPSRRPVVVPPATKRLELVGRNLLGDGRTPEVRLGGRPLTVAEADDTRLLVELPDDLPPAGTLEVDHGDAAVTTYELSAGDPWTPVGT